MAKRSQTIVKMAEAKARLPELVRRAGAGEEIIIARGKTPRREAGAAHFSGAAAPWHGGQAPFREV